MARILVVDDEISIRAAIQRALEPAGHEVMLAVAPAMPVIVMSGGDLTSRDLHCERRSPIAG
jgi:DNA-binding NtrC family response regulator